MLHSTQSLACKHSSQLTKSALRRVDLAAVQRLAQMYQIWLWLSQVKRRPTVPMSPHLKYTVPCPVPLAAPTTDHRQAAGWEGAHGGGVERYSREREKPFSLPNLWFIHFEHVYIFHYVTLQLHIILLRIYISRCSCGTFNLNIWVLCRFCPLSVCPKKNACLKWDVFMVHPTPPYLSNLNLVWWSNPASSGSVIMTTGHSHPSLAEPCLLALFSSVDSRVISC